MASSGNGMAASAMSPEINYTELVAENERLRALVAQAGLEGTALTPAPSQTAAGRLPVRHTLDGWTVVTIHWSQVPGYDYAAACRGLTEEGIRQELEIDWSATKGKRVYPEYAARFHLAVDPLRFDPNEILYCGWDFGGTPAFVPTQLNAFGQWLVFPPIAPLEDHVIGIYEFGQLVADHLTREYASKHNRRLDQLKLVHFGDPAGAARPPRTGDRPQETQSCFDILKNGIVIDLGVDEQGRPRRERQPGWGWRIVPGAVNITERLESVRARLKLILGGGLPAFVVDPGATVIKDGLSGGYHYPQRADGSYAREPLKNWYSHSIDALGYIATRLFYRPAEEPEEDDEEAGRWEFRSHAAPREGYVVY